MTPRGWAASSTRWSASTATRTFWLMCVRPPAAPPSPTGAPPRDAGSGSPPSQDEGLAGTQDPRPAHVEPLSERELEVMRLLGSDLDGPAIARAAQRLAEHGAHPHPAHLRQARGEQPTRRGAPRPPARPLRRRPRPEPPDSRSPDRIHESSPRSSPVMTRPHHPDSYVSGHQPEPTTTRRARDKGAVSGRDHQG